MRHDSERFLLSVCCRKLVISKTNINFFFFLKRKIKKIVQKKGLKHMP